MVTRSENANRDHWLSCAKYVSLRVNCGWWLETLAAPLLIAAMLGACAALFIRREIEGIDGWKLLAGAAGLLAIVAGGSFLMARRKFDHLEQSLVRIEASMHLKNALSTARAGIIPWPPPIAPVDAGLRWQWSRVIVPIVGALGLLAAGVFFPLTARDPLKSPAHEAPQAWKKLESDLDYLAKEEAVDEKYIDETRKSLDELKAQEEEQWFGHSSLEATDSLEKSHQVESERVERELGRAEKALSNIEKNGRAASQVERAKMMEEFEQALQALQNGLMKPNSKLLEQMRQLNLENMTPLSAEQIEQLRQNLKKNQEAMTRQGEPGAQNDASSEKLLREGEKDGAGDTDGNGGVNRGPGHDPDVLGKKKEPLEIGQPTALQAKDLSKSMPGDLLELQDGEHDVDLSASKISKGGDLGHTGKGGDRVWRDSLDPAEQRALKRFFESSGN